MITRFKSALNQVKADKQLISRTEVYLKDSLLKDGGTKFNKSINYRLLFMNRKLRIAACYVVFLLAIGGISGIYGYYQTPVSYISVDINPSVELGINTFGRVVKAEGYNNDGDKILKGINVKGSDVTSAIDTLLISAIENGYIAKDGSSIISLISETDNKNTAANLETEAETGAKEALTDSNERAEILKDNVSLDLRDKARKLGITPGKLNLIEKLQKVDKSATVEQYKNTTVKDIMKAIQNSDAQNKKEVMNKEDTTNDNSKNNEGNMENKIQNTDASNSVNTREPVVNNNKDNVESKPENANVNNKVNVTESVKNNNVNNENASKDKKQVIDKKSNKAADKKSGKDDTNKGDKNDGKSNNRHDKNK